MAAKYFAIRWTSEEAKGYVDIFNIANFSQKGAHKIENIVIGPRNGQTKSEGPLIVFDKHADLDYAKFTNKGWNFDPGILRLHFKDAKRSKIYKIEWEEKDGEIKDVEAEIVLETDISALLKKLSVAKKQKTSTKSDRTQIAEKLKREYEKYKKATPKGKKEIIEHIERGIAGNIIKQAADFKCQLCEKLGLNTNYFKKQNGDRYVEAHHVEQVSRKRIGSLSPAYIMSLCANHHRQMHYGIGINVIISNKTFDLTIDGKKIKIKRLGAQNEN